MQMLNGKAIMGISLTNFLRPTVIYNPTVMPGIILIVAGVIILSIENPSLESYIENKFSTKDNITSDELRYFDYLQINKSSWIICTRKFLY